MHQNSNLIDPKYQSQKVTDSTFVLQKTVGNSFCNNDVRVDFSRVLPVFNNDKQYFTSAFVLEMDKKKYIQNKYFYRAVFAKKIQQMDEQKSQLFIPHPTKGNNFCFVCQTFYDDYLTHLSLQFHKKFMEISQFHKEIQTLCSLFSKKSKKVRAKKKQCQKVSKIKKVTKHKRKDQKSQICPLIKSCSLITNECSMS